MLSVGFSDANGRTVFILFALVSFLAFGRFTAFFVAIVSLLNWIELLDLAEARAAPGSLGRLRAIAFREGSVMSLIKRNQLTFACFTPVVFM